MKKVALLISLFILMCACNKSAGTHNRLTAVEARVSSDPYHCFEALDSVAAGGAGSAEDSALYNLLYVEALHNVGLYTQNDSMIAISEKYYEKVNDRHRLAYVYLHHGISFIYNHQLLDAVKYIKRSERLAADLSDDNLKHDVYTNLGRANSEARCNELALKNYRTSLNYCDSTKQRERYARCLNSLAKVYERLGMTDSFMAYTAASMRFLTRSELKAELLTNIADYYFRKGQTVKSQHYADMAMNTGNVYIAARTVGDIAFLKGEKSKAMGFYYMAVNSDDIETRIYSYRRLIDYYRDAGDDSRTLFLSEPLNDEYQKYQKANSTEIADFQSDFDKQWESAVVKKKTVMLSAVILLLILIVISISLLHRRNTLRLSKRIEKMNAGYAGYLQQYREVSRQLEQIKGENINHASLISEKTKEIESLKEKLSEYQEDNASPEAWNIENELLNSDIVFRFHRLAARGKSVDDADWQQLNEVFAGHLSDFLPAINAKSLLSQREQSICELIRLRFIPSEIASLMQSTPQVITNLRARLLEKIFGEKGGAKQFDRRIRDL